MNQKGGVAIACSAIFLVILGSIVSYIIYIKYFAKPVIDPAQEMEMQERDGQRVSALKHLKEVIDNLSLVSSSSAILCNGKSGDCGSYSSAKGARDIDGTGWISVDFRSSGSGIFALPLDPINSGDEIYSYWSDGKIYKIDAHMESELFKNQMGKEGIYEVSGP